MAFPCDGQNHYKAVKSESELYNYISSIEEITGKKINKIEVFGGTKTKVDNVIHFEDDTTKNISLKNKKSLKSGSFDYINTSSFDWLNNGFSKTLSIFEEFKNSQSLSNYKTLIQSISEELSNMSSETLTNLFVENVINAYKDLSLTIIEEKTKSIYCDVIPKSFSFVTNGGKLVLRKKEGIKMSYSVDGVDSNGNIVDLGLRIRVHLNNGKSKWLGLTKGSSVLVIKFQQDKVYSIVK